MHRGKLYSLLSAVPLLYSIEDWEKNRIYLDQDSSKYFNEFDYIERLKNPKLFENISSDCYFNNKNGTENFIQEDEVWEFYVQKDNMITWRREESDDRYSYKGTNLSCVQWSMLRH